MKRTIHFTKMHGAGNDYIYINTLLYNIDGPSELARLWSDRHKGIGSDGLVLIGRSPIPEADFSMRIFNADGSEAMKKGLADKTEIRLLSPSGLKVLMLKLTSTSIVENVTVDMGEPVFDNEVQFSPTKKTLPEGIFVSMGNPHYVIFTDDVDAVNDKGRELEYHPAFPERVNIEFAEMRPDGIRVRVWERGSGITMACGTGACAVAVAATKTGRGGRTNRIIMDGGTLEVEWREQDNHVYLTGPAEFVYEGEIEINSK